MLLLVVVADISPVSECSAVPSSLAITARLPPCQLVRSTGSEGQEVRARRGACACESLAPRRSVAGSASRRALLQAPCTRRRHVTCLRICLLVKWFDSQDVCLCQDCSFWFWFSVYFPLMPSLTYSSAKMRLGSSQVRTCFSCIQDNILLYNSLVNVIDKPIVFAYVCYQ